MLWSQELEVDRVKAGCVDRNSLVGRVDVEVPAEVVNFSDTTEKGMPNNSRCSISEGRDGQVRGARLRVLSKAGKQSSVHRPVQRLIRFEIQKKGSS